MLFNKILFVNLLVILGLVGCKSTLNSSKTASNITQPIVEYVYRSDGLYGGVHPNYHSQIMKLDKNIFIRVNDVGELIKAASIENLREHEQRLSNAGYFKVGILESEKQPNKYGHRPSQLLESSKAEIGVSYWKVGFKEYDYDKYGNQTGTLPADHGFIRMSFWSRKKPEYADK